ncbi:MAG: ChaN family lipoprotein [Bdellovibrionota bacterium]
MSTSRSRTFAVRPDAAWLRARRRLLRQLKSEVSRRMGREPTDVRAYTRRYERELAKPWSVSDKRELLAAVESADIVFGGDFHALGPAQRTHLKILRSISEERPVTLCLECFSIASQKWLDLYAAGKVTAEDLRKKSRWETEWGFPWENYRPLFELARRRGWSLVALNSSGGKTKQTARQLESREKNAARVIVDRSRRAPDALVYVIFGDLHLANSHLPAALMARGFDGKKVTIHLNSERIYLDLARRGLELGVDVVKFSPTQFCVLSSPPWVKWQSYLLFLDRTTDAGADEGLDDGSGDGSVEFDPTDQVARLAKLAALDLGVELKVDDLGVYADDESIWRSVEKSLRGSQREIARYLLANGRSFFLPAGGVAYLSRTTVNHAAAVAGEYLHARLSGRSRALWDFPRDFRSLVWTEAVAYFVSKLVNHKRQAETLTDLRAQLAAAGAGDDVRETLRLALDMSFSELVWIRAKRKRGLRVRPRRRSSYVEASRILGGMMGERLYLAFRSRRLKREDLVSWMSHDPSSRRFADVYDDIVMRLASFGEISMPRKERL